MEKQVTYLKNRITARYTLWVYTIIVERWNGSKWEFQTTERFDTRSAARNYFLTA